MSLKYKNFSEENPKTIYEKNINQAHLKIKSFIITVNNSHRKLPQKLSENCLVKKKTCSAAFRDLLNFWIRSKGNKMKALWFDRLIDVLSNCIKTRNFRGSACIQQTSKINVIKL
jgi:hypothetical protein